MPEQEVDAPLTDEEAMALGESQMNEILRGKGKIRHSFKCDRTGYTHEVMVPVADTALQLKILEYKTKKKAAGTDDAPKKAKLTLDWFREASDEELAKEFHLED